MVLNPYDCRIRCLWAKRKMFVLVPTPHRFPVVTEFCGLGLRELGGRTRKRSCSNRIIPSCHFYKRSEAYSSRLPSIWRCWLAKRNWESKGEQTQQGEMLSGRFLSFPPFFEVLLAKERQKQKISSPKSEARRLWTPAWKGNERLP